MMVDDNYILLFAIIPIYVTYLIVAWFVVKKHTKAFYTKIDIEYEKIVSCIYSCKNEEQVKSCTKMVVLFSQKHEGEASAGYVTRLILLCDKKIRFIRGQVSIDRLNFTEESESYLSPTRQMINSICR